MKQNIQILDGEGGEAVSHVHHTLRSTRRRIAVILIAQEFDALANEMAAENPSKLTVRKLSKYTVAVEEEIPLSQATGNPYHSVYNSLIQTHLPELQEIGAIDFDSSRKTIRPSENLTSLRLIAAISLALVRTLFDSTLIAKGTSLEEASKNQTNKRDGPSQGTIGEGSGEQ